MKLKRKLKFWWNSKNPLKYFNEIDFPRDFNSFCYVFVDEKRDEQNKEDKIEVKTSYWEKTIVISIFCLNFIMQYYKIYFIIQVILTPFIAFMLALCSGVKQACIWNLLYITFPPIYEINEINKLEYTLQLITEPINTMYHILHDMYFNW